MNQKREHVEIYLNKVTNLQSKYIALHVGLFWGIGRYIIHDGDKINVKIDNRIMFDHLSNNEISSDEFINTRTGFILQFIKQRKLNVNYQLINTEENLAEKLI